MLINVLHVFLNSLGDSMYSCKSSGWKYAVPLAIGLTLAPGILDKTDQISGKYFAAPVIEYVQNVQKDRKKNIKVKRDVNNDGKGDLIYLREDIELGFRFYKLIVKEGLGDGKFGKEHLIEKFATDPPEDLEFGEDGTLAYTEIRSRNAFKLVEKLERKEKAYKGGFSFSKAKTIRKWERPMQANK